MTTMGRLVMRGVWVGALGAAMTVTATSAHAQRKPKSAAVAQQAPVDMDADQPVAKPAPRKSGGSHGAAAAAAGAGSDVAAQAKKFYETEKYWDAAQSFYRVSIGETGDDEGNKQNRAVRPGEVSVQAALLPSRVLHFQRDRRQPESPQVRRDAALGGQARHDLPEPADIIERVGKYSEEHVAKFNNDEQRELYWQLNYLLGRYRYRNGKYPEALELFDKVNRKSKYYVQAQFFSGITNVQMRRSSPAVQSFQRILGAIEEGDVPSEDEARFRDLAYLSMARTFYSASIKVDENTNQPTVDQTRLSAAVKYWNKVDVTSEYWLDALFEESWAYFMAGDYSHALGNIHTIQAPYFPHAYYPEADVLKAVIYFSNCQYDDALTIVAKFRGQFRPIREELDQDLDGSRRARIRKKPSTSFCETCATTRRSSTRRWHRS